MRTRKPRMRPSLLASSFATAILSRNRQFSATHQEASVFNSVRYHLISSSASLRFSAIGFSERTCLFASRAARIYCDWFPMGRLQISNATVGDVVCTYAITTASMSGRLIRSSNEAPESSEYNSTPGAASATLFADLSDLEYTALRSRSLVACMAG